MDKLYKYLCWIGVGISISAVLCGCQAESVMVEKPVVEQEEVHLETSVPIEEEQEPIEQKIEESIAVEAPIEPKQEKEAKSAIVSDVVYKATNTSKLANETKAWWFKRNAVHEPPAAQKEIDLKKYNGYYLGDPQQNQIYLTFDEGYENGFTPRILDILKENDVKAAFFVTKPYIVQEQALVRRMIEEGHVVANHSVTHPSMPSKSDQEVQYEIQETARYYQEVTGQEMAPFFRPPRGEYSERTLEITRELGYKTIFWSMAYVDWDVNKQPGRQYAYNHVLENHHKGAVILLHAVSQSNTEALHQIIVDLKAKGYEFASLYELPGADF